MIRSLDAAGSSLLWLSEGFAFELPSFMSTMYEYLVQQLDLLEHVCRLC